MSDDDQDPVRVTRFEWERLMMMGVPHPQNLKLLPIGIFMSASGGKARPGNAGLALFGPHEKTWAKLLRWAVKEGWLVLVERGGARRGPGGATVVRASVYAASVPREVWERRQEILGAAPFRVPSVEGSDEQAAESVESPDGPALVSTEPMKGALTAPFNGSDQPMKGAPRDSVHESEKGATGAPFKSFEGSVSRFEGSAQTLPHHVVTSSTSSIPEPSPAQTGGRDEQQQQHPDPLARAAAFLEDLPHPWAVGPKTAAEYAPLLLDRARAQGWRPDAALAAKLTERPSGIDNYPAVLRIRIKDLPKAPTVPAQRPADPQPALPPYCGDIDCDEKTRMRDIELDTGHQVVAPCPECHPNAARKGAAA